MENRQLFPTHSSFTKGPIVDTRYACTIPYRVSLFYLGGILQGKEEYTNILRLGGGHYEKNGCPSNFPSYLLDMCFLPLLSEVSMKDVHARDSMERNSLFIHPLIKTNVDGWPKKTIDGRRIASKAMGFSRRIKWKKK